jgi:hypothetical protein
VEYDDGGCEDPKTPVADQFPETRDAGDFLAVFLLAGGASSYVIDIFRANHCSGTYGPACHDCRCVEDPLLSDLSSNRSGEKSESHIACVVKSFIPPDSPREVPLAHDSKRNGRDGGREESGGDTEQNLRQDFGESIMRVYNSKTADSDYRSPAGDQPFFTLRPIDEPSGRALSQNRGDALRRDHNAHAGRVPMARCGEIDGKKRANAGIDIGHEKIQPIERA